MAGNLRKYFTPRNLFYISTATVIIGLFTTQHARALPNFGLGGMTVASFFYLKNWRSFFKLQNLPYQAIFLLFFIYALSGFQTDIGNEHSFSKILQLKTAFLVIPFSFCLFPKLTLKEFTAFLWVFLISASITAVLSLSTYAFNFSELNNLYLDSKAIPVAGNHVRYSLLLVSAILSGGFIYFNNTRLFNPNKERKTAGILTLFLILFLHILAVRSGLLAFYSLFGVFILYSLFTPRLKKFRTIGIITIVLLPLLVLIIPTSRNKIKNTLHDLTHIDNPYSANYESLTARLFSYRVANELFIEHKALGVGVGNLKEKTEVIYIKNFAFIKNQNRLIPHNQFLYNLVAFGVVGSTIYLILLFAPLLYKKAYKNNLFLSGQYIILTSSFLFEATLETQLGLSFSLFFIILPLSTAIETQKNEKQ